MTQPEPLRGKVGIVTAGGTGIGQACARAMIDAGARVMICARREHVIRQTARQLGDDADAVVCDVTNQDSVDAAVAATVERFGSLDLAVHSAGVGGLGSVLSATDREFSALLDTTLCGVFRSMRAAAKVMKRARSGSIVNISSIASTHTHRWMTAYCTAKAGVNMLTRCAADDLGEFGIRVNAVSPGLVKTDMAQILTQSEGAVAEYLRRMAIPRVGEPRDVAALVVFLLSDSASWITGQCIGVDGGHSLRQGPDLVEALYARIWPVER